MSTLLRKLRQRFGIAARPMAVRTHVALHWRVLGGLFLSAVVLGAAWWLYGAAQRFAGFDREMLEREVAELRTRSALLEQENERLRAAVDASESSLNADRTALAKLKTHLRTLEDENARLKDDLAFFETLAPAGSGEERLAIHGLRVTPAGAPGEYRYRMLLLQGAGTRDREFQGSIQLVVELQLDGRSAILTLPDGASATKDAFKLAFKRFRRVEGRFKVEPGATVQAVTVRVLETGAGEPRATQVFRMS